MNYIKKDVAIEQIESGTTVTSIEVEYAPGGAEITIQGVHSAGYEFTMSVMGSHEDAIAIVRHIHNVANLGAKPKRRIIGEEWM